MSLHQKREFGGRRAERKAMIDHDHALPVSRQAQLLGISRGNVYYRPERLQRPISG